MSTEDDGAFYSQPVTLYPMVTDEKVLDAIYESEAKILIQTKAGHTETAVLLWKQGHFNNYYFEAKSGIYYPEEISKFALLHLKEPE